MFGSIDSSGGAAAPTSLQFKHDAALESHVSSCRPLYVSSRDAEDVHLSGKEGVVGEVCKDDTRRHNAFVPAPLPQD